ncbi:MAG: hypothetical protein WDM90_06695 [Ferruginibacter sp.]
MKLTGAQKLLTCCTWLEAALWRIPWVQAAGVMALQQAWRAAVDGLSLKEATKEYPEFKKSVEKFG